MAKVFGPDFISLQVRDLAASRTFYTQVLGLPIDPRFDTPEAVVFDTNSIPFGLSAAKGQLDPAPNGGVTFWLDCNDVEGLHADLLAAGATVIRPPFDSPFGRALVLADPDGYRITANQNQWDRFPLGGSSKR